MMTKEGSTKILFFMTIGAVVLIIVRGHISHYREYVVSSTLSKKQHIDSIVLREYDAAFQYHR